MSTGIFRPTRRAVRANLRGLPNDSTYSRASLVWPSCSHQVSRSLLDTSYLSPADTNDEQPMPSRDSCSSSAMPIPPDCTTSPAWPGSGCRAPNVASRASPGTASPKQLGPTSRMPYRRQVASRSGPASPRPAVTTTRERIPRRPHSAATLVTAAAGTAITARSGTSGRSATEAAHGRPSIECARGLTG